MPAPPRLESRHFAHWPPGQSQHLSLPDTNLFYNVEVSATRFPHKPFIVFYDRALSFSEFKAQAEAIAGYLQQDCGVKAGDRVLLQMQNSPQWILACYGILRAGAVVVPVNPMNKREELRHYVHDAGTHVAFVAQDLLDEVKAVLGDAGGLRHVIVATYADYLPAQSDWPMPEMLRAPRIAFDAPALVAWSEVLDARRVPTPLQAGADDLAVMPYTSGTTGQPKGCMHTHRSVMSTAVGGVQWFGRSQDWVMLATLPFFHVTGMSGSMNGPLFAGGTVVILPRWDREVAARFIERYRVTSWQAISTMVIDFVSNPKVAEHDLSSLVCIRGGGAAMPEAVAAKLKALTGLDFIEGYGMSETLAATHINPVHRPKAQCLGIPVYDVDARLVDPQTLEAVPHGEVGEIVVHGPQVMQGYWRNEAATREAFIDIEGKRFLRTGDLARVDDDGYFFMADRLKRMINASGFKVWPAEVESLMYHHPAIREACVIAARDPRRGETVKALVVLEPGLADPPDAAAIAAWCHERMAAYKVPRIVEFVASLPRSGSGKVMWRELQAQEDARDGGEGSK